MNDLTDFINKCLESLTPNFTDKQWERVVRCLEETDWIDQMCEEIEGEK